MALRLYPMLQRYGQLAHFDALIEETLAANQSQWEGLNLSSNFNEELLAWVKPSVLQHLGREIQDTGDSFTPEKFCDAISCYEYQAKVYVTSIPFTIAKLQAFTKSEATIFKFFQEKGKVLWETAEIFGEEEIYYEPLDLNLIQSFYDNTVKLHHWVPNWLTQQGIVSYFIYLGIIITVALTLSQFIAIPYF